MDDVILNLQLCSDIHLEYYTTIDFETLLTPNRHNILCLLGDIGDPKTELYKQFILWCSQNFYYVLLLTGNHEYYGSDIESTNNLITSIVRYMPNVIFMNNKSFIYCNKFLILGTTLWSYVPEEHKSYIQTYMNDYRYIKNLDVDKTNQLFLQNFDFLNQYVEQYKNKYIIVILSHHTPSFLNTSSPNYNNSLSTYAFSTEIKTKQIHTWCYGHTHYNNDFIKDETRIVSNQRGYKDNILPNYKKDFTITLY